MKIEKPGVGRPLLGPAKMDKVVELVGEGSVINGPTPSSFSFSCFCFWFLANWPSAGLTCTILQD